MPKGRLHKFFHSKAGRVFTRASLLALFFGVWGVQAAYAGLTITPTTWNVIGLDSNSPNTGPDTFQVGGRICNNGGAAVTNVAATLFWDTSNAFINLNGPGTLIRSSLAPGACSDVYFSVVVTRTSSAYNTTRGYHITVSGDSVGSVSTPTPRELYVEHIISQGRNSVNSITGPTTVYVGQTYTYTVNASTATQGYEQLEAFLDLSNVIFEVQSIATTYTAPSGATNDKFYADACGWDNNPLSGSYRSCIGPANYSGGKAGGTINTVYTVKVLSTGSTTASTLILDFSGSSYHYNSDFGTSVISITALPPPLTLSKSANPTTMTAPGTVSYTLRLTNAGSFSMTVSDFVDTLPTSPGSAAYVAASSTFNGVAIGNPTIAGAVLTWNGSFVVPAGQTRDLVFSAALPSVQGTYTNSAIAHMSGFQIDTTQNTSDNAPATASVTMQFSDLTLAKTHSGNFTVGVNGTYTLTASNAGAAATSGTITVTDNLPSGLTVAAIPTGTGWNCATTVVGSTTATCTSSTVIAAGATSPNPITVSVVVAPAAFPSVTNVANISGGNEPASNNGNNSASDPTTVNGVADLSIAKSHSGNFTVGVNGTYTLTASNSGTLATSGTITVVDNLPAGLTIAALPTGTGWNCSTTVVGSSTATCTSATVIAAGATSPNPITVTVVVAPAAFPSVTNAANISGGGEPAYNNGNNSITDPTSVNGVADLLIAKSHSGNFTVGVNGTYTLTASNSGTLATSGTITVTDNLPSGLTVAATPTGTGWNCSTTVVGSSTATCTSATVIAAGATSPNPITVTVVVAPAAFPSVTNAATISGGGEPAYNNGNNSANDPTTVNGVTDLTIAKTHVGNFTQGQVGATYSITATNSGSAATSGTVTVTDTLPAGLTATAISGTGWACVLGTLTCTRSDVLAAGSSYPVITLTVTVANNAPASVTNSATVSGGGEPAYNNGNNTATNPTTINQLPDLTITKSHVGNFTQGQVGATYSITATNSGSAATSGTVTVVDTLPAGLTATAISGTGWACVLGTLTCTRSDALAAGSSYPVITLTVTVANNAPSSVTNSVSVSGGGQTNTSNDTATNPTTINQLPDLTITKSHVGNFTQGQVGATYSITATNSGSAATSGTVTVVDTLPAGLTATAISGTGWTCVLGTLTCTRSDALAAGSSYPVITLTVTVANNAPSSVTNSVNVSGGGQTNTSNDSATDATTINQLPDLTITKSHVGNFTQGQVGATYSITATNSGSAATSGTVTVVDTLPAGLTATAISGTGWACVLGTLTCTRSDALAAGSSYPVITLTVTVANNAPASVTNSVSVSGGGQTNTSNDTATNPTTINQLPDLTITKSHVGNFTQGQTGATYSLTATNSGFAATSGTVTVTDTLPSGLTATAISGTGWVCVLGTLTCTRSDALAAGSSYPVITLTVNVSLSAPASVTNSANVSGGGQTNTTNDTANDPTTINAAAPPSIGLVKSVSPSGTQNPGTDLLYTIVYTNSGGQPANNFVIVDPNPANAVPADRVFNNVDFKVGSLTSAPGSSGLVASFQYSNNGGSTWIYTPVSGGGGAPAGYDRNVTNVRWSFAGSLSQTGPNNTGSVTLTVRIR